MTTIIRSGSKVSISGNAPALRKISSVLRKPIIVGNKHVPTHVSIPAKKLPVVKKIIGGGG